jgi:hypothetical protein
VFPAPSTIPKAGTGLFAKQFIAKGAVFCTYGGRLVDPAEAQYLDPTYTVAFEQGKGFKLIGDNEDGDLGLFANAIQPDFFGGSPTELANEENSHCQNNCSRRDRNAAPLLQKRDVVQVMDAAIVMVKQNARFELRNKRLTSSGTRGRFDVVAIADIAAGQEVFVNYGNGYWFTMQRFWKQLLPAKPQTAIDRDARARKRALFVDNSSAAHTLPRQASSHCHNITTNNNDVNNHNNDIHNNIKSTKRSRMR